MDTEHGGASSMEVSAAPAAAPMTMTTTTTGPTMMTTGPTTATHYVLPPEGINLAQVERSFVEQALQLAKGNQTRAAKLLGISRFALRSRLDRHGLRPK